MLHKKVPNKPFLIYVQVLGRYLFIALTVLYSNRETFMIPKKILFVLLCVTSLITFATSGPIQGFDQPSLTENIDDTFYSYTTHDPIRINNDTDFDTQGWPGDGSESDPYVIQDLEINGTGYGYCVYIGNTTVNFLVKNNYFHHANRVEDLTFYYMNAGVYLHNITNGKIENNLIMESDFVGIYIEFSSNNIVSNNTASYSGDYGILMYAAHDNQIINNTCNANDQGCTSGGGCGLGGHGIALGSSDNNEILNNNVSRKNARGIYLSYSDGNILHNNSATYNTVYGISLDNSNKNHISENDILNNTNGLLVSRSDGNLFEDNTISNQEKNIYLDRSMENTIHGNILEHNGIIINDFNLVHWNTHDIDDTNTINGRPIIYWKNRDSGILPSGAGQIILANCTGVTVGEQYINNIDRGIQLGFSHENIIYHNDISDNDVGLYLYSSGNNIIYHNNFVDNTKHVEDDGVNNWDNGWPDGGNYWSDHTGNDENSGPDQDESGSDGIIDIPYDISGIEEVDKYPLITPGAHYLYLEIVSPIEEELLGTDNVTISWSSYSRFTDMIRYEIKLNDGGWMDIGDILEYNLEVSEGSNIVSVRGYDENEDSALEKISFTVDTTPPILEITYPLEDDVLTNDNFTVEWTVGDAGSGIDVVNLRLNNGEWIDVSNDTSYEFNGIGVGEHIIELFAQDMAGHNSSDSVTIMVDLTSEDEEPEEDEETGEDEGELVDEGEEDPVDEGETEEDPVDEGETGEEDPMDEEEDEGSSTDTEENKSHFANNWISGLLLITALIAVVLLYLNKERLFGTSTKKNIDEEEKST